MIYKFNRKLNKLFFLISVIALIIGLTGCVRKEDVDDGTYVYEVYSLLENKVINTIDDKRDIDKLDMVFFPEEDYYYMDYEDIENKYGEFLQTANAEYQFVLKKKPVAKFGSKEYQKLLTISTYQNSNIIKGEISAVEKINIINDLVGKYTNFYQELTEEDMNYIRSFVK